MLNLEFYQTILLFGNSDSAYGISFSPDNSKLYVTYPLTNAYNILQYDLNIPNFQNFPYIVISGTNMFHDALQIAPDGKIYCAKQTTNTLGVINSPNLSGVACNYNDVGLVLSGGSFSWYGLPNLIDNKITPSSFSTSLGSNISVCENGTPFIINADSGFTNYLWSNGSTLENIQVLDSGSYSVTVTNSNGCSASDTIIVFQPPFPNYLINSITDTLGCANLGTGAIDIDVIGGTGSYTYQWSNGATTQDLNNLTAGTYTVTVTDSIGYIETDPPITIVQVNDMLLSNNSMNLLKCHDDTNGFIDVTVLNGLSPNNYEWSNGATTEDLNNLTTGTYSVTVSDAGGCTASNTVVITAPNQVIASLTTAADTVFCNVTGGTPSYHYLWSTGATTAFITSATNGTYTVTVSDINNCTAVATLTIDAVSTIDGDNNFEIYPNPVSEELIVKSEKLFDASIEVIDVLGRTVQSFKFKVQSPAAINVSDLSEGVYFIKLVSSSGTTEVKKFVVVH